MSAKSVLDWTRTSTPLGTGPQPAAYTIPPRGLVFCREDKDNVTPFLALCQRVCTPLSNDFCLDAGDST